MIYEKILVNIFKSLVPNKIYGSFIQPASLRREPLSFWESCGYAIEKDKIIKSFHVYQYLEAYSLTSYLLSLYYIQFEVYSVSSKMAPKAVCVLKSEKVNGVVKFEQEVRSHDLVF